MPLELDLVKGTILLVTRKSSGGDVSGPGTSTDRAITSWNGTTGDTLRDNPKTKVQADGAVNSQGFITKRTITGTVVVEGDETWIAPALEMGSGAIIQLGAGAQIIIL